MVQPPTSPDSSTPPRPVPRTPEVQANGSETADHPSAIQLSAYDLSLGLRSETADHPSAIQHLYPGECPACHAANSKDRPACASCGYDFVHQRPYAKGTGVAPDAVLHDFGKKKGKPGKLENILAFFTVIVVLAICLAVLGGAVWAVWALGSWGLGKVSSAFSPAPLPVLPPLLDANGIYDGQNGNGLIPWKEIKEVVVDRVEDHTYLVWTKDSFSPGRVSSNYDTKLDVTCSTGVDLAIPLNDRAPRKSFLHKFESIQGVPDDWREMLAKIAPNVVVRLKLEGTRHGATLDLLAAPPEKWKKCYQLFPRPTGKEAQEQEVVIHDWDDRDFALAQAQAKAAGNDLKKAVAAYKTYHAKNANGRHVEEADEAIGRISKPGSPKPEAGYRPPVDKKPGDAKPPANPKPPAAEPWPLCDGKETVAAYAMRAGVEPAETLELGVVALELVLIPAGKFLMGSPETKKDRGGGKQETQHEVTITRPYYMGRYEVTQEEYERVMRDNPSAIKGARNPVESVSRWRAEDFCKKASEKTGFTVRLPTEAEWEYACRAGTKTAYYTGDSEADLDRAAWYYKNSNNTTHPVGQKAPNAWGLFDMHGNVEEWCADWYATYKDEAAVDPQGPAQGKLRVSRGGSGRHGPEDCRSAARWLSPTGCDAMSGFRVVAEVRRRP